MDIQQPPRGATLDDAAMQRWMQDVYNSVKCPSFRVYVNGSYNTFGYNFGGSSWNNKVNYSVVDFNNLGGWDTANQWFQPKVPGYYFIEMKLTWQIYVEHTSGNPFYVGICVNRNGAGVVNVDQSAWYSNVNNFSQFEIVSQRSSWLGYLNGKDDYAYGAYYNALTANNAEIAIYGAHGAQSMIQGFKISY